MQIECEKNELDLLEKSFEILNPDYDGDIKSILGKFDKWSDFTYKVKLRLNKRSKSDQTPRTNDYGGFQLEFVSTSQVINYITCYKFSALIG